MWRGLSQAKAPASEGGRYEGKGEICVRSARLKSCPPEHLKSNSKDTGLKTRRYKESHEEFGREALLERLVVGGGADFG
jgi:hypothetical protein